MFGEIGLRGDARQLDRRPRETVVHGVRRQGIEGFPRLIQLVHLLPIVFIRGETVLDAAAIGRRKLAVEIGHQLIGRRRIRLWIDNR